MCDPLADTEILEPIRVPAPPRWYRNLLGWPVIGTLIILGASLVLFGCSSVLGSLVPRPPVIAPAPALVTPESQVPEFLRPRLASDPAQGIQATMAGRVGLIIKLEGEIGALRQANVEDRKTLARQQEDRIRAILYWIAGICLLVMALTGVAGFIPALSLFRGTLWGIAAGAATMAGLSIGAAPLVEYLKWLVGALVLGGLVTGVVLLFRLHLATMAAKLNAHLADELEKVNPLDPEAVARAKGDFQALRDRVSPQAGAFTRRLRDKVLDQIPDRALKKRLLGQGTPA